MDSRIEKALPGVEALKLTKDIAFENQREIVCQCGKGDKHTVPLQDWTDVSIYNTAIDDCLK